MKRAPKLVAAAILLGLPSLASAAEPLPGRPIPAAALPRCARGTLAEAVRHAHGRRIVEITEERRCDGAVYYHAIVTRFGQVPLEIAVAADGELLGSWRRDYHEGTGA